MQGTDTGGDAAAGDAAHEVPGAPSGAAAVPVAVVTTVSTLAGSGTGAFAEGTGAAASFNNPYGLAVDAAGNVYVADRDNERIRKITAAGVVTTLAGSGNPAWTDGTGAAADFFSPSAVAVDGSGNVYVSDQTNQRVRFVSPAGEVSTLAGSGTATFADGTGAAASFNYLFGIAVDAGNVWIADTSNNRIRKMTVTGAVTTLAGSSTSTPLTDGIGAAATFNHPAGIALDANQNAYVADTNHHCIRIVSNAGVVTTLAGSGTAAFADGPSATAEFNSPAGIAVDAARNVYVGDTSNNRIRKITSAGLGELAVSWTAPSAGSSAILGYTASASAVSHATKTCVTGGATSCTITGLASGVVYNVSISASNAAGMGAVSATIPGTPN